jgi:hypothetical protein
LKKLESLVRIGRKLARSVTNKPKTLLPSFED